MDNYFKQPISEEIFKKKYCLNGETSVSDVFSGIAKDIAMAETSKEKQDKWEKIFYNEMINERFFPAGRVMANARVDTKMRFYNNCFREDAQVLTSTGLKPISKVVKGEKVLTHRGNWKSVTNTLKRRYTGIADVYNDSVLSGELVVTPEHPFYQGDEKWAESKDNTRLVFPFTENPQREIVWDLKDFFKDNDRVKWDDTSIWRENINNRKAEKCNRFISVDKNFAYALGIFIGDGSTFKNNPTTHDLVSGFNICFNKKDMENRDRIKAIIEEAFGIPLNINITGNDWHYLRKANFILCNVFRMLCGTSSYTKRLPEFVWAASKGIQEALLTGVFDSDGTVNVDSTISFTFCNKSLVFEIQNLAHILHIPMRYTEKHVEVTGKTFEAYYLYAGASQSYKLRKQSHKQYDDARLLHEVSSSHTKYHQTKDQKNLYIEAPHFTRTTTMYDDYVYNISVEEDESYVVNGVVVHNCYTIDVEDSIKDIYTSLLEDALISSTGGGVGFNVSALRPKDASISKGGESSGVISFLKVFDQSAQVIHTGGGRRAAHIAILNVSHPDIEDYLVCKQGETNKQLTQFNISVGITDAFMEAVIADAPWDLVFEGKVYKTISALDLFNRLTENSFTHNEPGIFNLDTVERFNTGHYAFRMDRCNPCGEITMPSYSICCLSAINLPAFVSGAFTEKASFDFEAFAETVKIGVRFLDNVLDRTGYPLDKIEENSKNWRRIGLGFTGLGDVFAMLGEVYGDEASKTLSEKIGTVLRETSYMTSALLAKEKGAFPQCDIEKIKEHGFIAENIWSFDFWELFNKYGLRNIGLNTVAPTGTTSLSVGNNCSSGIEPIFSLGYNRRIRQSSDTDDVKTEKVYDKAWLEYIDFLGEEPKEAPEFFTTTMGVSIDAGLEIQAIFQKHIDHSISKTINLPPGTTINEYRDVYMKAYALGLKGTTTFNPEGSMQGILEYTTKDKREEGEIEYHYAPPRPKDLPCEIHEIVVNKTKMLFVVGLLNGKPYEIFVETNPDKHVDCEKHKSGVLHKRKRGCYDLMIADKVIASDLSNTFDKDFLSLARSLSMSLRHGVPLQFIVAQMNKDTMFGSFQKGVSRILKKYIVEGEAVETREKSVCPECGADLLFVDGCISCSNMCGWSKCG